MSEQPRLQPRKQPRQIRAELTRQRILDAAAHVFADHGYAAGTTNRIAEQAKVSVGSLYQYYPNKDAILLELLTRHVKADPLPAMVKKLSVTVDLESFLGETVRAAIDNHRADPQLLQVMFEQAPRISEVLEQMDGMEREIGGKLEVALREHPQVAVRDIGTAARLVVATIELTVHRLVAAPASLDPDRLESELVAMLFRYLTGESQD